VLGALVQRSRQSDRRVCPSPLHRGCARWRPRRTNSSCSGAPRAPARPSIIAGYPWFSDWGRDTMIALPGTDHGVWGRFDTAAAILRTYARFRRSGYVAESLPGHGRGRPKYNTADAALWMFQAGERLSRCHAGSGSGARPSFPRWRPIIHAHADGTRYGIHVDSKDGLLCAGEPGTQVTWMGCETRRPCLYAAGRQAGGDQTRCG